MILSLELRAYGGHGGDFTGDGGDPGANGFHPDTMLSVVRHGSFINTVATILHSPCVLVKLLGYQKSIF